MKIQKKYLEVIANVTAACTDIPLKDGRVRDAFLKELGSNLPAYHADLSKIYEKFCEKDEAGKSKTSKPEKGRGVIYHFKDEVLPEVNKELEILDNEIIEIKTTPQLKAIIEKTEYKPKVGESGVIDEILALL